MIGGTCKHSNVFSAPVLIARGLDLNIGVGSLWSFEGAAAVSGRHAPLDNSAVLPAGKLPLPFRKRKVNPARADGPGRPPPGESRSPPFFLGERAAVRRLV